MDLPSTITINNMKYNSTMDERNVSRVRASTSACSSPNKRRKSNSLPTETVEYLKAWMMSPEHIAHPYPTEQEKAQIMAETGIELKQLTNWFVNNRKRYWKPRVEAKLQEHGLVANSTVSTSAPAPAVLVPSAPTTPVKAIDIKRIDIQPSQLINFTLAGAIAANMSAFVSPAMSVEDRCISASTSSSSLSALGSSIRFVSDNSENENENESIVSSQEDDTVHLATGQQTTETNESRLLSQTEYITVTILRPNGDNILPTIDDVTTLVNVPDDRVLHVFKDCILTYSVPSNAVSNQKQIQLQRDSEIAHLKIHYLQQYLSQPVSTPKRARVKVEEEEHEKVVDTPEVTEEVSTPRPKFCRVSVDTWKGACEAARDSYYDSSLPTLEEAATLFGFARS